MTVNDELERNWWWPNTVYKKKKKIQKDFEKSKENFGYNNWHVEGRSPKNRLSLDLTLTTCPPASESYSKPTRLPVNSLACHWIYANKLA